MGVRTAILLFSLLRPSHASLIRQNICIDQLGLERIQSSSRLAALVDQGVLSPLPIGRTLAINPGLPENRRYALPRTNAFILRLSEQFYAQFGKPLIADSAVRDAATQQRLRKRNAGAAPADGETASSHESGATIDIGKKSMNRKQLQWMRNVLTYEVVMNRAIVEDERHQNCFHIFVMGDTE